MKRAILQNELRNLVVMAASVFALAACGGGGGGGGDHGGGLPAGTFTRTFNASPLNFAQVFGNGVFGDMTVQSLLTAAEIGGAGKITKLRFTNDAGSGSPTTCPNSTLRLGHTTLAALTTTYASNFNLGTPVIVLNNATVTIPAGAAGDWFEISLATPFEYDGVNNLIVQLDRTTTCSGLVSARTRSGVADRMAVSFTADTMAGTAENNTTTGALFGYTYWLQVVFAGGEDKLDFGGVGNNTWPIDNNSALGGLRIQSLYLASEINGSGPITGIAYQANATTVAGAYNYTLRFGHSTLAALTTDYAGNYAGSPTVVANAVVNFAVPAGIPAGEWVWVPIPDGVFTYNGTDNLIVDVSTTSGTASSAGWRVSSVAGRRAPNNGATATTAALVDANLNHIALRFRGGPMMVITPGAMTGGSTDLFPFYDTNGIRQFLYVPAELGTSGAISRLACRTNNPGGAAQAGFNYTVVLGHRTASTLGTTFASNLTGPITVFSGTLNLPATVRGDWLEIPFTTPFAYNGKDNLVVQVSGTGGPGLGTGCAVDTGNAVRYAGRRAYSGLSTDTTGAVSDFLADMRFTLN